MYPGESGTSLVTVCVVSVVAVGDGGVAVIAVFVVVVAVGDGGVAVVVIVAIAVAATDEIAIEENLVPHQRQLLVGGIPYHGA